MPLLLHGASSAVRGGGIYGKYQQHGLSANSEVFGIAHTLTTDQLMPVLEALMEILSKALCISK